MARFCTLCSSSSGNATYIGTASYGILIDAGLNCKQLTLAMDRTGIDPDAVKAIFVTHEHSDHTGALKVFAAKHKLPVYATGGTLAGLMNDDILNGKFPYEKIMERGVDIGDIHVSFFRTSHDAKESCGYRVELPDRTIGVATDTGRMMQMYAVNAVGPVRVVEAFYDLMHGSARKEILLVSSEAGSISASERTGEYGYCMSKAALNMYGKNLYNRLHPEGYDIRLYYPGWIRSYMAGTLAQQGDLSIGEGAAFAVQYALAEPAEELYMVGFDGKRWNW